MNGRRPPGTGGAGAGDAGRARGKPTIVDVANLADVHPSTVSRALNPDAGRKVSPATTERVLAAAKKLGYRPNPLARGLKIGSRSTVGMLIPDMTNPLFPPIIRGIEDRLREAGWTLLLANTDNDEDKERVLLGNMLAQHVDGLILATARRDYALLDDVKAAEMPVVLVNRTSDRFAGSTVAADDHAGIGLAVNHLADLGHREIAYVGGPRTLSTGLARYRSFRSWMVARELPADERRVCFADWFQEGSGVEAFEELLRRDAAFTAVVCGNDLLALGGYTVLARHGLRVPDDVSVVGYNDTAYCDKAAPALTSVRVPHYHIGVTAADLLLDLASERERPSVSVSLQPELTVRASTGPPSGSPGGAAGEPEAPRYEVRVAAVVIREDGRVLVVPGEDAARRLPEGSLRRDEDPDDAVRRIVSDATGVCVDVDAVAGLYREEPDGPLSIGYRCRPVGARADGRHGEHAWLPATEARTRLRGTSPAMVRDAAARGRTPRP